MKAWLRALALAAVAALVVAAAASAHARISPSVAPAKSLELYSLVVPTEKEGVTTTKVVLTLPAGFSIDSFVRAPGWKRVATSTTVTWTGGHAPTEEDALFQFLAQAQSAKTYTFAVEQTYSDGSVVDWNGSSTDTPAPTVEAKSSLGGGGGSTLALVALVVAAVGVVLGGIALVARAGRQLA